MTFRGALVSRSVYIGVSIDQVTNDGYFPTQKDHLHLLEGASKYIWYNPPPPPIYMYLLGEQIEFGHPIAPTLAQCWHNVDLGWPNVGPTLVDICIKILELHNYLYQVSN